MVTEAGIIPKPPDPDPDGHQSFSISQSFKDGWHSCFEDPDNCSMHKDYVIDVRTGEVMEAGITLNLRR